MPDMPLHSDRCLHNVAVGEHDRSSFVVAVDEHEHSTHVGRQDSIVLAFLGKVNYGSRFGRIHKYKPFRNVLSVSIPISLATIDYRDPEKLCVSRGEKELEREVVEFVLTGRQSEGRLHADE